MHSALLSMKWLKINRFNITSWPRRRKNLFGSIMAGNLVKWWRHKILGGYKQFSGRNRIPKWSIITLHSIFYDAGISSKPKEWCPCLFILLFLPLFYNSKVVVVVPCTCISETVAWATISYYIVCIGSSSPHLRPHLLTSAMELRWRHV